MLRISWGMVGVPSGVLRISWGMFSVTRGMNLRISMIFLISWDMFGVPRGLLGISWGMLGLRCSQGYVRNILGYVWYSQGYEYREI